MSMRFLTLLICSIYAVSVFAGTKSGDPGCSTLGDAEARLSCYDAHFGLAFDEPNRTTSMNNSKTVVVSPVLARQAAEESQNKNRFALLTHRPNYILPATYNANADWSRYGSVVEPLLSDSEIKLQVSLKTRVLDELWGNSAISIGYTQQSYWQLYAEEELSAPFRETNHEPEVMWDFPINQNILGFDARQLTLSLVHQSNGQVRPLSRSWNRLAGEVVLERGNLVLSAKSWKRIFKEDPDDNPNIEDYMGRIHLGAAYRISDHTIALGIKNGLGSEKRGSVELNWQFPLTGKLRGFVQLYSGYGENMIDMEEYANRIGIGVALTDWL